MRIILTFAVLLFFAATVFAQIPVKKYDNMPQGTFKKSWSGKVVQYDKNGRKVGVYKLKNGKYVKVK